MKSKQICSTFFKGDSGHCWSDTMGAGSFVMQQFLPLPFMQYSTNGKNNEKMFGNELFFFQKSIHLRASRS
jgi:hypothetical protein